MAAVPSIVTGGQVFRIDSPDSFSIDSVVFIRPGANTHNFDQNQRYVPLSFTPFNPQKIDIVAPASRNDAPPGY